MARSFGLPQISEYLRQMGLKIASMNTKQNVIELSFHGDHGQWRMVIGLHQTGNASKLMLIVPHLGVVTAHKRLECLEALMAVNYRIAIGKFGLDIDDGEIRLEETIPLADHLISFEQFRLAFTAIMQTASIYHSLLPRIVYGNLSAEDALLACEQDFFQHSSSRAENDDETLKSLGYLTSTSQSPYHIPQTDHGSPMDQQEDELPDLNVEDILEEVSRMLREKRQ